MRRVGHGTLIAPPLFLRSVISLSPQWRYAETHVDFHALLARLSVYCIFYFGKFRIWWEAHQWSFVRRFRGQIAERMLPTPRSKGDHRDSLPE
jgi:hypothetical protein